MATYQSIINLKQSLLAGIDIQEGNSADPLTPFYQKGYSKLLPYDDWVTLGCTPTIKDVHLPSSNQAVQISSSAIGDSSLPILVKGYDNASNEVMETITLNAISGRTAVTLANSYFRINTMINLGTADNVGEIYLSIDGSSLTNGVPSESDCMYLMKTEDNLGSILNYYIPPKSGGKLYPNYVLYSVSNDTYSQPEINFQTKYASSSIWLTQFEFFVNDQSQANFTYSLRGIPAIPNDSDAPFNNTGLDIRIRCKKGFNFGSLNVSAAYSAEC